MVSDDAGGWLLCETLTAINNAVHLLGAVLGKWDMHGLLCVCIWASGFVVWLRAFGCRWQVAGPHSLPPPPPPLQHTSSQTGLSSAAFHYNDVLPAGTSIAHVKLEMDGTSCVDGIGAVPKINGADIAVLNAPATCGCNLCGTKTWAGADSGLVQAYAAGGSNTISAATPGLAAVYWINSRVTVAYRRMDAESCTVTSPPVMCQPGGLPRCSMQCGTICDEAQLIKTFNIYLSLVLGCSAFVSCWWAWRQRTVPTRHMTK